MTTIRTNTVTTLRTTIHPLAALLFLAFAPAALAQDKPAPADGSSAQTQARSGPGRASKDGRVVSVSFPPGTAIATIQVDFAWKPAELPLTEADLSVIAGRFTDPRTGEQYEMLADSAVPAELGKGWKAARITTGWLHRLGPGLSGTLDQRQALATKKQAITSAINGWLKSLDGYAGLTKKITDALYDQKNQAEQQLRQLDAERQLPLLQQRLRELQIELFAKKARMAAMQKKIAEIRDQAGAKAAEDPILKELKEIVKIREEAVKLARQKWSVETAEGKNAAPKADAKLRDGQAKALEARVQVAQRQEAGVKIAFAKRDGKAIGVAAPPELEVWSEGKGDWPVNGDLKAFLLNVQKEQAATQPAPSASPGQATASAPDGASTRPADTAKLGIAENKWQAQLVSNIRGEAIGDCIANLGNFDDQHLADTSLGDIRAESTAGQSIVVTRLARVRRLLEEGRRRPDTVIGPFRSAFKRALDQWPQARQEFITAFTQAEARGAGFTRGEPMAYDKIRTLSLAATYVLAELGDHESLPLMVHAFEMNIDPKQMVSPAEPAITLFAMHQLILSYPEARLTPQSRRIRDEYLAATKGVFPEPEKVIVTRWQADYSESDPRVVLLDLGKKVLRDQPTMEMRIYPVKFADGQRITESMSRPTQRTMKLFEQIKQFVQLSFSAGDPQTLSPSPNGASTPAGKDKPARSIDSRQATTAPAITGAAAIQDVIRMLDLPWQEKITDEAWDKAAASIRPVADEAVATIMMEFNASRDNAFSFRHRAVMVLERLATPKAKWALIDIALGLTAADLPSLKQWAASSYVRTLADKTEARVLLPSDDAGVLNVALLAIQGIRLGPMTERLVAVLSRKDKDPYTRSMLIRVVCLVMAADPGSEFAKEKVDAILAAAGRTPDMPDAGELPVILSGIRLTFAEIHQGNCLNCLSRMKSADAPLREAVGRTAGLSRDIACIALAMRGEASMRPEMLRILQDDTAGLLRKWAAEGLGHVGTSQDVPLLKKLAESDPLEREAVHDVGPPRSMKVHPVREAARLAVDLLAKKPAATAPATVGASTQPAEMVITPGVGVGPITLGMSKEDVIKHLGKPDKTEGKGSGLNYISSMGLSVMVSPRKGVVSISCWTSRVMYWLYALGMKDFRGATDKGIKMGAGRDDIVRAYGKADSESGGAPLYMDYRSQGIEFILCSGKLAQIEVVEPDVFALIPAAALSQPA